MIGGSFLLKYYKSLKYIFCPSILFIRNDAEEFWQESPILSHHTFLKSTFKWFFFLKLYYLHLSHDTHMVKHTVYFELFCFFFVRFLLFHLKCLHLVSRVGIESYYTVRESSNFLPCGLYLPLTLLLMHTMLDPSTYLNLVTKENLCLF